MSEKISEIKIMIESADKEDRKAILDKYREDSRSGVQKLIAKYDKEEQQLEKELERLEFMKQYERKYSECSYICGIDEAGRGPLAGPVVASAVILPKDCTILYLNDSKKLSEKKREMLYDEIMEKAISVGVGVVSPAVIDEINILQADYEAMRIALSQLSVKPEVLLNDAVTIPNVDPLSAPQALSRTLPRYRHRCSVRCVCR